MSSNQKQDSAAAALAIQEAEAAVLGAILVNQHVYFPVADFLSGDDFFLVRHRYIWEAVAALVARDDPANDIILLKTELKERGRLDDVGGIAYLVQLVNNTPTASHAEAYARLVKRAALRRQMLSVSEQFGKVAIDEGKTLEEVAAIAEKLVMDYVPDFTSRTVTMKQAMSDHMDMAETARDGDGAIGIPSWLPGLNDLIGGYEPEKLYILAGRPGHGKTSFAVREAVHMAKMLKTCVGFISLEMSTSQIVNDMVAMESQIPGRVIQMGLKGSQDWSRYVEAAERMSEWPIVIDDTPALTAEKLAIKAKRMHRQHGIKALFIDYMQLMDGSSKYAGNRVQEVSHISRTCKILAKELHIPVIALAQLSRDIEKRGKKSKRPVLADLRESGQIEQDADLVMFTWQEIRGSGEALPATIPTKLIVEKQRSGEVDDIDILFWGRYKKFITYDQEKALLSADEQQRQQRRQVYHASKQEAEALAATSTPHSAAGGA